MRGNRRKSDTEECGGKLGLARSASTRDPGICPSTPPMSYAASFLGKCGQGQNAKYYCTASAFPALTGICVSSLSLHSWIPYPSCFIFSLQENQPPSLHPPPSSIRVHYIECLRPEGRVSSSSPIFNVNGTLNRTPNHRSTIFDGENRHQDLTTRTCEVYDD